MGIFPILAMRAKDPTTSSYSGDYFKKEKKTPYTLVLEGTANLQITPLLCQNSNLPSSGMKG